MSSLVVRWKSHTADAVIGVHPWIQRIRSWTGNATRSSQQKMLVRYGALGGDIHFVVPQDNSSHKGPKWGSALAVSALLTLLVSVACTTVAQATPTNPPARAVLSTMAAKPASSTEVAPSPQIAIEHFMFGPVTLIVHVGTTVMWVNHDDDLHTVTSSNGLFSSPGLDTDDVFMYRFTAPGIYSYFCALHPHMKGTIIVQ